MIAYARLSAQLIWYDKVVWLPFVLTPLAIGIGIPALMSAQGAPVAPVSIGMMGLILSLVGFAQPLHALTSRRDQLVLKRLRTTRLSGRDILGGEVLAAAAQCLLMAVLVTLGGHLATGLPLPASPLLFLVVMTGGGLLMGLLCLAATVIVPRAELSMLVAMPLFFLAGIGSGGMGPLRETLPSWAQWPFVLAPTDPIIGLVRVSYGGRLDDPVFAILVVAFWAGLSGFVVHRWFRWEPRHG